MVWGRCSLNVWVIDVAGGVCAVREAEGRDHHHAGPGSPQHSAPPWVLWEWYVYILGARAVQVSSLCELVFVNRELFNSLWGMGWIQRRRVVGSFEWAKGRSLQRKGCVRLCSYHALGHQVTNDMLCSVLVTNRGLDDGWCFMQVLPLQGNCSQGSQAWKLFIWEWFRWFHLEIDWWAI